MKKKNDFGMWLTDKMFSRKASNFLNALAGVLVLIWFGYHIARFIFRF